MVCMCVYVCVCVCVCVYVCVALRSQVQCLLAVAIRPNGTIRRASHQSPGKVFAMWAGFYLRFCFCKNNKRTIIIIRRVCVGKQTVAW